MSSDALTEALKNNNIKPQKNFREYYIERWENEIAKDCKIKIKDTQICRIIDQPCSYDDCFRRSIKHANF